MASAKLTQAYLANLQRPASGTLRVMDTETRGFCVDVGTKSIRFFLRRQLGGRLKPVKLGEFPAMTVSQARRQAEQLIAQITSTGSVVDAVSESRKVPSLEEAMEAYIEFRTSTGRLMKSSTVKDLRQRLGKLSDWADKRITSITRQDVSERHAKLTLSSGPAAANGAMRWLSAVLNWASDRYAYSEDRPLIPVNPVIVLTKRKQWNPEVRRQTFVQSDELPKLWQAIMNLPSSAKRWETQAQIARDYFLFCLFTGMRPDEALRLEVKCVDLRRRVFLLEDTKNRDDFCIPFSSAVHVLLERRIEYAAEAGSLFVFPSFGHHGKSETLNTRSYWKKISTDMNGFVPKDLRRTFTTLVSNMEPAVPYLVLKRLLNHRAKVVDANDVTAGYFATDVERLRPVVQRISDEIMSLASSRGVFP